MAQIILITGGSRSGKSTYAQTLAESIPGSRTYIATCPPLDEEMAARIKKHRAQRQASLWQTLEETIDLAGALLAQRHVVERHAGRQDVVEEDAADGGFDALRLGQLLDAP